VPKTVHCSGCRDKHNWPRPLTPQSIMPSLNHCDLLRHISVNNLPKVITRQSRPRHCRKGAQPVPKAVHRSGCRDKHWWAHSAVPCECQFKTGCRLTRSSLWEFRGSLRPVNTSTTQLRTASSWWKDSAATCRSCLNSPADGFPPAPSFYLDWSWWVHLLKTTLC